MKSIVFFVLSLVVALTFASAAQLYRWVDDKGNVEWRDTPPPPAAKKVETRTIRAGAASTPDQPYSVQQAAKNFPVTLWTTDCGDACNRAREHLARRGVPHAIKNPQADFEGFRKTTGGTEVPFLQVGNSKVRGYQEIAYDDALDYAGYPKTALVPMKPQAVPAVPPPKPVADGAKPAETAAEPAPAGTPAAQAPTTPAPAPGAVTVPTIR